VGGKLSDARIRRSMLPTFVKIQLQHGCELGGSFGVGFVRALVVVVHVGVVGRYFVLLK
jgi:hypothetical protein